MSCGRQIRYLPLAQAAFRDDLCNSPPFVLSLRSEPRQHFAHCFALMRVQSARLNNLRGFFLLRRVQAGT